jgi:hypothetical protein
MVKRNIISGNIRQYQAISAEWRNHVLRKPGDRIACNLYVEDKNEEGMWGRDGVQGQFMWHCVARDTWSLQTRFSFQY